MKKFSQSDLLGSAAVDGAGRIINKFFESKYERLYLEIPKMDLVRGKVFVSDVNDLIRSETNIVLTIEKLIVLIYEDFLRQVQTGMNLEVLGRTLLNKKNEQREMNYKTVKNMIKKNNYSWILEEKRVKKKEKNPLVSVPFRILKKFVYRGEVLLYDLSEVSELDVSLEELISLYYIDFITKVKNGDTSIIKSILSTIGEGEEDV